ncbi:MAG: heavy metal-associated domain-containing protein [Bacteroidota bacterium]
MFDLAPDRHAETFAIDGMSCGHCVSAVRDALEGVDNVVVTSVEIGHAAVDAGPEATRDRLVEAIEAAGFDVTGGESHSALR